ncbi:hypothetical protein Cni_G27623 [Canna indica]|uniref:RIN4 pathogenic type III effector avirulence factor Avr cleavage site domain-containing protein n=1 Tax=Canna indica TaxID=4628 RepID=A0AAQ3QRK5_9LILI|nr:hypothetical protein Cni_G27623 [Canna indica]
MSSVSDRMFLSISIERRLDCLAESDVYVKFLYEEKGQALPKFGEWDVNNPASADGFTVIFNKARDEKKTGSNSGAPATPTRKEVGGLQHDETYQYPRKNTLMLPFCPSDAAKVALLRLNV